MGGGSCVLSARDDRPPLPCCLSQMPRAEPASPQAPAPGRVPGDVFVSGHSGHYRCVAHGYCMTDSSGHFRGRPEVCRTPGHRGIGCIMCPVAWHKWSCCDRDFGDACTGAAGVSSGGAAVSEGLVPGACVDHGRGVNPVRVPILRRTHHMPSVPSSTPRPASPSLHQAAPVSTHVLREYVDASVACPSCGMYGPCGASAPPNMPGTHECTACRWCDKCCAKKPVCGRLEPPSGAPFTEAVGEGWPRAAPYGGGTAVAVRVGVVPVCVGPYA